MAEKYKVFVYGTLKKGFGNHRLLSGSKFLGKGRTDNRYALYKAGLPFVLEDEQTSPIAGEVYEVNEKTLSRLDRLEGHPNLYCRKIVDVSVNKNGPGEDGERMKAWIYFFPRRQGVLVKSGIFC